LVSRDGVIATVTLNNPAKLNAVNASMWRRLRVVMDELSADESLRCVVLRGAGEKAFAAGGDLEEFLTLRDTLERALVYHEEWVAQALNAIRDCLHPTVALIQGGASVAGWRLPAAATCASPANRAASARRSTSWDFRCTPVRWPACSPWWARPCCSKSCSKGASSAPAKPSARAC
jgi:1,4-dihydroxy-2-naphthoyl-CoA synthase